MDDQDSKAKFLLALHKHTLHAYASGGILGVPGALTVQNDFGAQQANTDYQNYGNFINQAGNNSLAGYGQAQNIQAQQQQLANQLEAQGNGEGPNPARAALAASTGQNVANQGALMAGQRGAGANVGLLARQAAQQGAATQQQAVGQSAVLQAQQQIAARQALAQQQAAMAQGNIAEQGAQNSLYGTSAGAQNTQNANMIQNAGMAQGINSQVAQNNANAVGQTQRGLMSGAAGALGSLFSEGGNVDRRSEIHATRSYGNPPSGDVGRGVGMKSSLADNYKKSEIYDQNGKDLHRSESSLDQSDYENKKYNMYSSGGRIEMPEHLAGIHKIYHGYADGGSVANVQIPNLMTPVGGQQDQSKDNIVSSFMGGMKPAAGPGYDYGAGAGTGPISPELLEAGAVAAEKGADIKAMNQNQKATKKDNSKSNDKIPALLSEGEIVLPRSITNHPKAPEKAAEFVRAALAKRAAKK